MTIFSTLISGVHPPGKIFFVSNAEKGGTWPRHVLSEVLILITFALFPTTTLASTQAILLRPGLLLETVNVAGCRTTPSTVHSAPLQVVPDSFFSVPVSSSTPINVDLLESWLFRHPDKGFVEFIISGLRFGFRIG